MKDKLIVLLLLLSSLGCNTPSKERSKANLPTDFEVQKTKEEWKKELSRQQYYVLREAETEPPHSSALIEEVRSGQMLCAACGNPLFDSGHKYTTRSKWPSFDQALEGAVVYANDFKLGYKRVEVLCAKCGSHLGHVFNDGPKNTTGKRYCINGVALDFKPITQEIEEQIRISHE